MDRHDIIRHALSIAEEYGADDLTLTLRQMYYQFVSRGLCGSGQKEYKRIGAALTEARYNGDFPVEWLEDRGRSVDAGSFGTSQINVEAALDNAADELQQAPTAWLWRSRWWGQPVHVSVWVEKEALAGIFEPVCQDLGVSWFACRGYPSVSALSQWLNQVEEVHALGWMEKAVVLYFGDHDPDGWEIPRSAERNLEKLRDLRGTGCDYPIQFERIALNMDQIRRYRPPPFEAKMTSARYAGYVAEHDTDEAWELDALEPRVLRSLIEENVGRFFDLRIEVANVRVVGAAREEMRQVMRAPGWVERVLGEEA